MDSLADPVRYAIPAFLFLVIAEALYLRTRQPGAYEARDTRTSLLLGVGNAVIGLVTGGLFFALALFLYRFRLFDIPWTWWAWAACFVLDDLAYYWSHRWMHRVRFMWASHVVHHSSRHYNLSTALRQPWTGYLSMTFVTQLPLFLLGFPPAMVIFCSGANLVYQFWIHTEAVRRLPGWVEAVMNTPSHHRVHHAVNPRYLDRNYAGVFIVWDRLFGSFEPERDDERCEYGIVRNLGHFNFVRAALQEWAAMGRDVRRARSWRERWDAVAAPPGTLSGETAEAIRERRTQGLAAETPPPAALARSRLPFPVEEEHPASPCKRFKTHGRVPRATQRS